MYHQKQTEKVNIKNSKDMENSKIKREIKGTEITISVEIFEGEQLSYINYRDENGKLQSKLILPGFEYTIKNAQ